MIKTLFQLVLYTRSSSTIACSLDQCSFVGINLDTGDFVSCFWRDYDTKLLNFYLLDKRLTPTKSVRCVIMMTLFCEAEKGG